MESFVANTEGGGNVAGAREAAGSPIPEGLAIIVRPLIAPERGNVELTLRLNLVSNISFRKPTIADKLVVEMANVPVEPRNPATPKVDKTEKADKPDKPDKPDKSENDRVDLFGMPIREASRLMTQVVAPKGKWVLAGTIRTPPEEKKLLHVFVSAEIVEP
jgi:hypothetical protein